jgi:hypothetical protein
MPEEISKALAQFTPGELEAPSHQARELAETRDYEVRTRINTTFESCDDSIKRLVRTRRLINSLGELPNPTRNQVNALEAEAFETARENIRNLRYHQ